MKWNESQIKESYDSMKKIDTYEFNKNKKCELEYDLTSLQMMLNYINHKKVCEIRDPYLILDEDYFDKVNKWINKNLNILLQDSSIYNGKSYKDVCNLKNNKLSEETISRLTYLFLNDYNEELKEKLFNLNANSHIYYDSRKKGRTIGDTFHLVNNNENYILVNRVDTLDSPVVLTREITKASDFDKCKDIKDVQNRSFSPFANAYANFNELLLMDNIEEYTEKEKLQLKISKLNSILGSMDRFNNYFMDLKINNVKIYELPFIIRNIMSNLLAIYWYQNYQNNEIQALKNVCEFNNVIGTTDIEDINDIPVQDMFNSFDNFAKDIVKTRTKK